MEITSFFSFIVFGMIVDNSVHVSTAIYNIYRFLRIETDISLYEYLDFASILFWLLVKILFLYFLCAIPVTVTDEVYSTLRHQPHFLYYYFFRQLKNTIINQFLPFFFLLSYQANKIGCVVDGLINKSGKMIPKNQILVNNKIFYPLIF